MFEWRIDRDGICHLSCESSFKDENKEWKTYYLRGWDTNGLIIPPYCFYCNKQFPEHYKLQIHLIGIIIRDVMQNNE